MYSQIFDTSVTDLLHGNRRWANKEWGKAGSEARPFPADQHVFTLSSHGVLNKPVSTCIQNTVSINSLQYIPYAHTNSFTHSFVPNTILNFTLIFFRVFTVIDVVDLNMTHFHNHGLTFSMCTQMHSAYVSSWYCWMRISHPLVSTTPVGFISTMMDLHTFMVQIY